MKVSNKLFGWFGAAALATLILAGCAQPTPTEIPAPTEETTPEAEAPTEAPTEAESAPDGDDALTGTSWVLTGIDGTAVDASTGATLAFEAEGRVTGNGGCNGFGGTFVVEGDKVTFGEVVSTLMACDTPKMDVETPFLSALQGSATYAIDGDTLTLTTATGTVLTFAAQ